MKINGRIILFTIVLVALQTICKLAFADKPDLTEALQNFQKKM